MGNILAMCRGKATQCPSSSTDSKTASGSRCKRTDSLSKYVSHYRTSRFDTPDYDPLKYDPKPLTKRQKMLLQKSYDQLSSIPDPLKPVLDGFVRMFVLAPESMQTFEFLREDLNCDIAVAEKKMLKNTVMRKHLSQVFRVLGDIVKDVDAWEAASEERKIELGRRHMWYGAKTEFIKSLCDGFLFAIEKTLWPDINSEILQAWEDLFLRVARDWAKGYQAETECAKQGKSNPFLDKPWCGHEQLEASCDCCHVKKATDIDERCLKSSSAASHSPNKQALTTAKSHSGDSAGSSSGHSSSSYKQVPP